MTSAPASPCVAEELVEKCIEYLTGCTGCRNVICADVLGDNCDCGKVIIPIIALAQDAARKEDAEWCATVQQALLDAAKASPDVAGEGLYEAQADTMFSVASHLRAMMVKP